MRFTVALCLALCVASAFANEAEPVLGIMEDALQNIFEEYPINEGSASMQTKARHVVVASSLDRLEEKLTRAGVHAPTAQTIASEVVAKRGQYFTLTKLLSAEVGPQQAQTAICVFRETSAQNTDLLCLIAETAYEGSFADKTDQIRSQSIQAIKQVASKLPSSITRYHAFTDLSITQFNNLKSLQANSLFDSMIRKAIAIKDQVVNNLSQQKNDPFLVKLFKNGIMSYTGNTKVEVLENVETGKLRDYASYLAGQLNIPTANRPLFVDNLYMSSFIDKNEWKELNFQFKPAGTGSASMVTVTSYLDSATGKVEFVNWKIFAAFEIGSDYIVSTIRHSSLFGLFSSTTYQITKRPPEIDQRTIEYLFSFFKAAAFDKIRALRKI